jgi:heterodisulfide reductase subunit A
LILGAGISGIHAALELADAGHPVYLVEKQANIGGHMAQLDKTFPSLECSACILAPKMFAVSQHPNITLLTLSTVESVLGHVGNFSVRIRISPRFIDKERCTGCMICEEKCPKKVIDHGHNAGIGMRKAIYRPFAQAVPALPVLDRKDCIYFLSGKCRLCEKNCPAEAVDFNQKDEQLDISVGHIIMATGYKLFNPSQVSQYGYGRFANVFSSLEIERMFNSAGPTDGKMVLRDGKTIPKKVAIIHCVGSRDKNFNEYCSKVCCMYSLKFALQIMEQTGAEVYNFYIDIRTPGKGYEEFYHRLQEKGANFIRGRVAMVMDAAFSSEEESHLIIQVEDTLISRKRRIPVDMVILSPAMEPQADASEVAHRFGLSCDDNGFFSERHVKLAPVSTMADGILIAGACQGPKDINESIAQAGAASARVLAAISRGVIETEPIKVEIDGNHCCGCRICNDLCPYGAISFLEEKKISRVDPAVCKGCGICIAACPSQIIKGSHFSTEQIMAEINGLLEVTGHGS